MSHWNEWVPSVKMIFSDEQCYFIIEHYFPNNKSFTMVRQLFCKKYDEHYMLPDSTINRIIQRFQNEHTILRRKGSESCYCDRWVIIWRLTSRVELSRATTHRLLRELNFKPYRLSVCQELKGDHRQRIAYCRWLERFAHGVL